jgi:hypothetical protein
MLRGNLLQSGGNLRIQHRFCGILSRANLRHAHSQGNQSEPIQRRSTVFLNHAHSEYHPEKPVAARQSALRKIVEPRIPAT